MNAFSIARSSLAASLLSIVLAFPAAAAVVAGQVDTFEGGSTGGWTTGPNAPLLTVPANVPSGGPAGVGDGYLQLNSVGASGPGGRLVVFNRLQWAGDYLAAGLGALAMDLKNFGPSDLLLRLAFIAPGNTSGALSTDAILVRSGDDWRQFVFPIHPAALTRLPAGPVEDVLSDTFELRLYHSTLPAFPGEEIVARLGVDNIAALQGQVAVVPLPGSAALLLLGSSFAGLLAIGRRRKVEAG